jgi:hypothetical protein
MPRHRKARSAYDDFARIVRLADAAIARLPTGPTHLANYGVIGARGRLAMRIPGMGKPYFIKTSPKRISQAYLNDAYHAVRAVLPEAFVYLVED